MLQTSEYDNQMYPIDYEPSYLINYDHSLFVAPRDIHIRFSCGVTIHFHKNKAIRIPPQTYIEAAKAGIFPLTKDSNS